MWNHIGIPPYGRLNRYYNADSREPYLPGVTHVSDIIRPVREADGSNTKKTNSTDKEPENQSGDSFSPDEISELGNLISDDSIEKSSGQNGSSVTEDDTGEFEAVRDPD
jgi:hypothetical protein